jgi:diguanylate cyclase (GGDEF)-like protein
MNGDQVPLISLFRAWSTPTHRRAIAEAYLPIIRGFLLPGAFYYVFVTWGHSHDESGWRLAVLAGLSLTTAVAYALMRRYVLAPGRIGLRLLEVVCFATNGLMYANVMAYMLIHFEETKLVYFVLMAAVFSVSGVTLRVTAASVLISIASLYWLANGNASPEAAYQYMFIGVATSFASFGMATLLRLAILRQIDARLLADQLAEESRLLSRTDALTGIPNRRAVLEQLEALVERNQPFWLGIFDLDGFKLINDIYGHVTGDELLRTAVRRILDWIAIPDVVFGRLGGDEFAVIIPGEAGSPLVDDVTAAINDCLRDPFEIALRTMQIGTSAGFAHYPSMARSGNQLYEMADYALYRAKAGHRGLMLRFGKADDLEMKSNVALERALREGDLQEELYIVFQPQVSLRDRRIVGFEALARWNSPALGSVPPDKFIRAAERSGMVHKVTNILLDKTLSAFSGFPEHLTVAFNLSALDLVDRGFALSLIARLNGYGIDSRRVEFEITETAVMTDFSAARAALIDLSRAGCKIALDDFGTGYSSLIYIDQLPLDKIKIDKGFVRKLGYSATSREIVATVIDLCKRLDLRSVLEGVETNEELAILEPLAPDIIQGYLFGKPVSREAALGLVELDGAVAREAPRRA